MKYKPFSTKWCCWLFKHNGRGDYIHNKILNNTYREHHGYIFLISYPHFKISISPSTSKSYSLQMHEIVTALLL